MRSIFVGGLPAETTSDDLIAYFAPYGEVLNINMPLKKKTGQCKGFAFVEVAGCTAASLRRMFEIEHSICGKRVDVQPTMSFQEKFERLKKSQENKIFISRVSRHVDLRKIEQRLSEYCEVWSCGFVNPKCKRKALLQVELSDPAVCKWLAETGLMFQGIFYLVSLYRPKLAWYTQQQNYYELQSELESYAPSESLLIKDDELFQKISIQKLILDQSNALDESSSNYRFNLSAKLKKYRHYQKPSLALIKGNPELCCAYPGFSSNYEHQTKSTNVRNLNQRSPAKYSGLTFNSNQAWQKTLLPIPSVESSEESSGEVADYLTSSSPLQQIPCNLKASSRALKTPYLMYGRTSCF